MSRWGPYEQRAWEASRPEDANTLQRLVVDYGKSGKGAGSREVPAVRRLVRRKGLRTDARVHSGAPAACG